MAAEQPTAVAPLSPVDSPGLRRRLPAGLLDSAASSLATFTVSLVAVHYLQAATLGAYSVAFSAFLLATSVPASFVIVPAEALAIGLVEGRTRLGLLHYTLPRGIVIALPASALAALATIAVPTGARGVTRWGLAAGLVALATVSPLQDHVRRLLHASGRSSTAAVVSLTQLGVVAAGIGVAAAVDLLRQPWAPFAILAVANVVSSAVGLARERAWRVPGLPLPGTTLGMVAHRGSWLLATQLIGFGAGFAMVVLIAAASGSGAVGYAEAARTLCQPPTVVIVGILAVLSPEIQSAVRRRDPARVRRLLAAFFLISTAVALVWGLLAIPRWSISPLGLLFPRAYAVNGLLILTLVGQTITYSIAVFGSVFLAVDRTRPIATSEAVTTSAAMLTVVVLRNEGAIALGWTAMADVLGLGIYLVRVERLLRGLHRPPWSPPPCPLRPGCTAKVCVECEP